MSQNLIKEVLLSGLPDEKIVEFLAALGIEFIYQPSESDIFKRISVRIIDKFNEVNFERYMVRRVTSQTSPKRKIVLNMLEFLNVGYAGLGSLNNNAGLGSLNNNAGLVSLNSSNVPSLPELPTSFEVILTEELPDAETLAAPIKPITTKDYVTILLTDVSRLEDLSKIIGGNSKFKVALDETGTNSIPDIVMFANVVDIYNIGNAVIQNVPKFLFSESSIVGCPMEIINLGRFNDPKYLEYLRNRFMKFGES